MSAPSDNTRPTAPPGPVEPPSEAPALGAEESAPNTRGHVKIPRAFLVSPLWKGPSDDFRLFVTLVMLARFKPTPTMGGMIPRGSTSPLSIRNLTVLAGSTVHKVRAGLERLQKQGLIEAFEASRSVRAFRITEFNTYNGDPEKTAQLPSKRPINSTTYEPGECENGRINTSGTPVPGVLGFAKEESINQPTKGKANDLMVALPPVTMVDPPSVTLDGPGCPVDSPPLKELSPAAKLVQVFEEAYRKRMKSNPPGTHQKHLHIAKKLLDGRSFEEAVWMVEEFYRQPPPYNAENGHLDFEHVLKRVTWLLTRKKEREEEEEKAKQRSELTAVTTARVWYPCEKCGATFGDKDLLKDGLCRVCRLRYTCRRCGGRSETDDGWKEGICGGCQNVRCADCHRSPLEVEILVGRKRCLTCESGGTGAANIAAALGGSPQVPPPPMVSLPPSLQCSICQKPIPRECDGLCPDCWLSKYMEEEEKLFAEGGPPVTQAPHPDSGPFVNHASEE